MEKSITKWLSLRIWAVLLSCTLGFSTAWAQTQTLSSQKKADGVSNSHNKAPLSLETIDNVYKKEMMKNNSAVLPNRNPVTITTGNSNKVVKDEKKSDNSKNSTVAHAPLVARSEGNSYRKNEIHAKFQDALTETLDNSVLSRDANGIIKTGIASLDKLTQAYKVTGMKRVFRPAGKFEAKHRAAGLHRWYKFTFDESKGDAKEVASGFEKLAEFESANAVYHKQLLGARVADTEQSTLEGDPDDPRFNEQWHYKNTGQTGGVAGADINLIPAWGLETGDADVIVAIEDGGIDLDNLDLVGNLWVNADEIPDNGIDDDNNGFVDDVHGYNFGDDGAVTDGDHGTHVAGTVAAETNNGIGVAGVAGGTGNDDGVRLMSVQVFGDDSNGGFAEGFTYAANMGAVISQNSWGYTTEGAFDPAVLDAIDYFIANAGGDGTNGEPMNGGIVIVASGNSDSDGDWYPGFYAPTLAVSSIAHDFKKAWYSNFGDWVDIAAPGGETAIAEDPEGVLSTQPNDAYAFFQGTSMACPHVSGVAALIVSKYNGNITPAQVRARLIETATDVSSFDPGFELGPLVNAFAALQEDDGIPPTAIADLMRAEVAHGPVKVDLTWTAPEDLDENGENPIPAGSYNIRYSETAITNDADFDAATQAGAITPSAPGTTEMYTVWGLSPSTEYFFAIKSSNVFGGVSDLSNVISATTTGAPEIFLGISELNETLEGAGPGEATFTIGNEGTEALDFTAEVEIYNGFTAAMTYALDTDEPTASVGLNGGGIDVATKYVVPQGGSFNLSHIANHIRTAGMSEISVSVYRGGSEPGNGTELMSKTYMKESPEGENAWQFFPLDTPVSFESEETFWIIFSFPTEIIQAQGFDDLEEAIVDVNYVSLGGSWTELTGAAGFLAVATYKMAVLDAANWVSLSPNSGTIEPAPPRTELLAEGFEAGIPATWGNIDNTTSGFSWDLDSNLGNRNNRTGGSGETASIDSDDAGSGKDIDTELITPVISVNGFEGFRLEYQTYYSNNNSNDSLNVDITIDGGTTWTNLVHWNEDHKEATHISIELDTYITGASEFQVRWHYIDNNSWAWYAQVDDVVISAGATANQDVTLTFDRSELTDGVYEAGVKIMTNDPFTPIVMLPVTLNVIGGIPVFAVEGTTDNAVDFGTQAQGSTTEHEIAIWNTGLGDMTVDASVSGDADFTTDIDGQLVIAPGEWAVAKVWFVPTDLGEKTATLNLATNDPNNASVDITLTGVSAISPVIGAAPESFDVALFSTQSKTEILTISNTADAGAADLEYEVILAPANARTVANIRRGIIPAVKATTKTVNNSAAYQAKVAASAISDNAERVPFASLQAMDNKEVLFAEDFDGGSIPADWSVTDATGNGGWDLVSNIPSLGNYTGGSGDAMGIDSDAIGSVDVDTELRTPMMPVGNTGIVLQYLANYRHVTSTNSFLLDISTDGENWTNISTWTETHGDVNGPNGELVTVELDGHLQGATQYMLRWHYLANFDWYAQIDNVIIMGDAFISANPVAGNVAQGASSEVAITFDASTLAGGVYEKNISILSNDPNFSVIDIPVTLTVTAIPVIETVANVDLGEVFTGQAAEEMFTISNIGAKDLVVNNFSSDNADFWIKTDDYVANGSGENQLPDPVVTDATGGIVGTIQVGESATVLLVQGEFENLSGAYTASHIHTGAAGTSGGVAFALTATVSDDGLSGEYKLDDNIFVLSETQLQDLRNGNLYFNLHSENNPGGELRGQMNPGTVIAPGQSWDATVAFVPSSAGDIAANLTISHNDPLNGESTVVELTGTGVAPPIAAVTPPSIDITVEFGDANPADQNITIANTGGSDLNYENNISYGPSTSRSARTSKSTYDGPHAEERKCASQDVFERQIANNPAMAARQAAMEASYQQLLANGVNLNEIAPEGQVRTIPVYVHVLWNTAIPAENISDAQVASQIDVLNLDFSLMNADFANTPAEFVDLGADYQIRFELVEVTRTGSARADWGTNDDMKKPSAGGVAPITPNTHMNMWVCNIGGGILGYAQFPGGPPETDGVVASPQYFGSSDYGSDFFLDTPFDKGRTMTHEVGHYINLRHIWGDGDCSADDFVADTPNSDGSNFGCPTYPDASCGSNDMTMNYMDYTDDVCMNMFSKGQKDRTATIFVPGGARENLGTVGVPDNGGGSNAWLSVSADAGTVAAAGSEDIAASIDLTGLEAGGYHAKIMVGTNDPAQSAHEVMVNLTITGQPNIITDASFDIGSTWAGTWKDSVIAVVNDLTSSAPLTVAGVNVDGAGFQVMFDNAQPVVIQRGDTLWLPVRFSPMMVGEYTGTLTIISNDPDSPITTIDLLGMGTSGPSISTDKESMTFDIEVGASASQDLVITNNGGAETDYVIYTGNGINPIQLDNIVNHRIPAIAAKPISDAILNNPAYQDKVKASADDVIATSSNAGTQRASKEIVFMEDFEQDSGTFPDMWTITTENPNIVWGFNSEVSGRGNLTGGSGESATADSDEAGNGSGDVDTSLLTPVISTAGYANFSVEYKAMFRVLSDNFDLDITTDDGETWTNVVAWAETHDAEEVAVDLASYIEDAPQFQLRWRYYGGNWSWYAQVDDVVILAEFKGLSIESEGGTLAAGASETVSVLADAAELTAGVYESGITILSSDPFNPVVAIPVTITVTGGTPEIVVSTDALDFGSSIVGLETATRSFTIQNNGNGILSVSGVFENANFAFSDGVSLGDVAPGEGLELEITYTPSAVADDSGNLIISTNVGEDILIALTGSGTDSPVTISVTPSVMLQELEIGASATQMMTITNSGTENLEFTIGDAGAGQLSITLPASSGQTLNAVEYKSVPTGTSSERVMKINRGISLSGADQINLLILTPDADVTPLETALAAFGDVNVTRYPLADLPSLSLSDLENYAVVLTTNNNQWEAAGSVPADQVGNVLADYVDQGGKVVLNEYVYSYDAWGLAGRFITEGYGPFTTATTDLSGSSSLGTVLEPTHPVMAGVTTLSNTGLWQDVSLAAGAIQLADWDDGEILAAANENVVAFNLLIDIGNGDAPSWSGDAYTMVHNAIVWLGATDGGNGGGSGEGVGYYFPTFDMESGVVAGGETVEVTVTFDATDLNRGVYASNIGVYSNDPFTPVVVVPDTLTVTGGAGVLTLDPAQIPFGDLLIGAQAEWTFTMANTGNALLEVTSISITGTDFTIDNMEAVTLYPGVVMERTVTYTPSAPGTIAEVLTVMTAELGEKSIVVSGTGLNPPAVIAVNPEDLDQMLGNDETASDVVTISNSGTGDLSYMVVAVPARMPNDGRIAENTATTASTSTLSSVPFTGSNDVSQAAHVNVIAEMGYDPDGEPDSFVGLNGGAFASATKFWTADGFILTHAMHYFRTEQQFTENIEMSIYVGGNTPDQGQWLTSQWITDKSIEGANKVIALDNPQAFAPGETFWIVFNYPEIPFPVAFHDNVEDVDGLYYLNIGSGFGTVESIFRAGVAFKVRALTDGNYEGGSSVSWLSLDPTNGTVASNGAATLNVGYNPVGLGAGSYNADILVISNDPVTPVAAVSVSMVITNRAPTLVAAITDQTMQLDGDAFVADLAPVFTDADGDMLNYWAGSDNEMVATVGIENGMLTVWQHASGTANISVKATDPSGEMAETTFVVTVEPVAGNNAPTVANELSDASLEFEGASQFVDVRPSFTDADSDELTYWATTSNGGVTVSITLGILEMTPVSTGTTDITVWANDGRGGEVSDTFTATVVYTGPNDAPVVANAVDAQTVELGDGMFSTSTMSIFSDADGDALTMWASSSDDATVAVSLENGMLSAWGVAVGSADVTLTANDGKGGEVSTSFTVTVQYNEPVVATAIENKSLGLGFPVWTTDIASVFSHTEDGHTLVYTAASSARAVAKVTLDGSSLTVTQIAVGTATISLTATDERGRSASSSFDVLVEANDDPTLTAGIENVAVRLEEGAFTRDLSAVFADANSDALTYTWTVLELVDGATTVTAALEDGILTVTPVAAGDVRIDVWADDTRGGTPAHDSFTVKVTENSKPVLATQIADSEEEFSVDLTTAFTDPDEDALTFTASSSDENVAGVAVSGNNLIVVHNNVGTATITVWANDGSISSEAMTFVVTVGVVTGLDDASFTKFTAYPNPVESVTTIKYELKETSEVTLAVYDLTGRMVQMIVNEKQAKGVHTSEFDATRLTSGLYLYRITANGFTQTKKMIIK